MSVNAKMSAIADAIRTKTGGTSTLTLDQMATEIAGITGFNTNIAEFTQMNERVTAFLLEADATYTDDNGDTVSVIDKYATSEGDYDRPLGLEITAQSGTRYVQNETSGNGGKLNNLIGGKSIIYNAIPNKVTQYLVKDSNGNILDNGRIKPTGKVRMIKFYGYPQNCRDLGGWDCDGGTVKYGKLFRCAAVGETSDILYSIVKELGIHHEIDLRKKDELTTYSLSEVVNFHHIPLALYFENVIDPEQESYENIKKILHTIFNAVTHNEAVIYHCAIGRDRTGTVSALLLSILGVAIKDIDKDFELTSFSKLDTPAYRTNGGLRALITALKSYHKSTLMNGAVAWCLKAGFTIDELNAFRSAMIDGTPTTLDANDFNITENEYTNLLPTAVGTDGTVYNGTGYKASTKLNSSGADTSANGMCVTGFIPCVVGDVIRMKGINYNNTSSNYTSHRIAFYDKDKTYIVLLQGNSSTSDPSVAASGVYDSAGDLIEFTVPSTIKNIDLSSVEFFRICGDTFDDGAIITRNEQFE